MVSSFRSCQSLENWNGVDLRTARLACGQHNITVRQHAMATNALCRPLMLSVVQAHPGALFERIPILRAALVAGKRRSLMNKPATIAILFLMSCSQRMHEPAALPIPIKFFTVGNIPVAQAKVNGRSAYFIIDTGASVSIINQTEARRFGLTLHQISALERRIAGFGGTSSLQYAGRCSLELGGKLLENVDFSANDMSLFVNAIYEREKIRIAGIIGSDVLFRLGLRIDYMDRTLSF